MVKPIGQVGSGKQEEISLGPAPAAEAAQPAAAALQAVVIPTFRDIQSTKNKLFSMIDREIAVLSKQSLARKGFRHEKNVIWSMACQEGGRRKNLKSRGVEVMQRMDARIAQLTTLFDERVAPLHAKLRSFLDNPSAVLADDGRVYVLNQDVYVEMLGNPNISTDAKKVVAFLRKQQGLIQSQKPKTAFEKETLRSIELAIDKVNSLPVSTLG